MWMCKLFHPFMVQYAICIISNINYCSCDMQYYYTASKAKCTTADPMRKKHAILQHHSAHLFYLLFRPNTIPIHIKA